MSNDECTAAEISQFDWQQIQDRLAILESLLALAQQRIEALEQQVAILLKRVDTL